MKSIIAHLCCFAFRSLELKGFFLQVCSSLSSFFLCLQHDSIFRRQDDSTVGQHILPQTPRAPMFGRLCRTLLQRSSASFVALSRMACFVAKSERPAAWAFSASCRWLAWRPDIQSTTLASTGTSTLNIFHMFAAVTTNGERVDLLPGQFV